VTTLRVFESIGPRTWAWHPGEMSWVIVAWDGAPARLYGVADAALEFPTVEAAEAHAIRETRRVANAMLDACHASEAPGLVPRESPRPGDVEWHDDRPCGPNCPWPGQCGTGAR
jgi:hypothetical protein